MKDVFLQIKIESELKKAFFDKAKKNAQNPSELVRQWIKKYVEGEGK